jgi:hypothetical protein
LRHKIHWTPQAPLEGSTYSIEEWNGSKGPNLEDEDDDDKSHLDFLVKNLEIIIARKKPHQILPV